jgi:hypothetical protein
MFRKYSLLVIRRQFTVYVAYGIYHASTLTSGAWGGVVVGRSQDRFPLVSLGIFSVATDGTICFGVESASKN